MTIRDRSWVVAWCLIAACGGTKAGSGSSGGTQSTEGSTSSASTHGATSSSAPVNGSSSGGGGSSGRASSGTGSSSSSGSSSGGCASQGASCQPANICDEGALQCSVGVAQCQDQQTANAAQTGVACGPDAGCEGSQCLNPGWTVVPNGQGGVIADPNLVLMTYQGDPDQPELQPYVIWLADGGYLPEVAGQYGVGNGTVQYVNLTDTPPDQYSIPGYLQTHLDTDPTMPPYAPNNIYILVFPTSWPDTASFCMYQGGYHTYFQDSSGSYPIYAVIPNCLGAQSGYLQQMEVAISHEVIEASTDPLVDAWNVADPNNPWTYLGGELGDLCASNGVTAQNPSGTEVAQLIWSNAAALAGEVPCQPWPSGQAYLSVVAPNTMATAAPGGTATVTLTGWASQPTGSWSLYAAGSDYEADFSPNPQLSSTTISAGAQVQVSLSVPSTALTDQHGAAWIIAYDSTGQSYGSTMVGVTAKVGPANACTLVATGDPCQAMSPPLECSDQSGTSLGVCILPTLGYACAPTPGCATDAGYPMACQLQDAGAGSLGTCVEPCTSGAQCYYPSTACFSPDGGVGPGACNTDFCSSSAQPFSACSAQGTSDGVCLPYDYGYGAPVEVCNQAGTLAAGATGCQQVRVDGGLAGQCSASTLCFGFNTPTCMPLCYPDGGAGGCGAGYDCVSAGAYDFFGVCALDCSEGETCPQPQTCYSLGVTDGGGPDACLP